jgi:molybdopterin converting factor small subunit
MARAPLRPAGETGTSLPAARRAARPGPAQRLVLLVATRKGAWLFHGDARRKSWRVDGPHFLGHTVSHLRLDPRDGRTLLAAVKTGHLGPTIFRSTDLGRSWKEAAQPPAFAKAAPGETGRAVDHTFWLDPRPRQRGGSWYAGTSPQGLFRSEDGGVTWAPLPSVNDDPAARVDGHACRTARPTGRNCTRSSSTRATLRIWSSACRAAACTSPPTAAQLVDADPGAGGGGGLRRRHHLTFHDPHCVRVCPSNPDRLYQQNHCGIYRLDRPGDQWLRIGRKMPRRVGDIGFPMVVHPRDADTAWVFPMDGTDVWPRTSPQGKPAAYVTRNGGRSWQRLDGGLPESQAWWTVKRQAMTGDARSAGPVPGHHQRRTVVQPRRGRALELHRPAPAGDLRGGGGGAGLTLAAEMSPGAHRSRRPMQVLIPSSLRSYTGAWHVQARGTTLAELLADLDRQFPGLRFRMVDEQDRLRPHMRIFVNGLGVRELAHPLQPADDVAIVQALSGG